MSWRWRRMALLVAALVIIAAGVCVTRWMVLARGYQHRMNQLALAGHPTSLEALDSFYAHAPENMAGPLRRAELLLADDMPVVEPWIAWRQLPRANRPISPRCMAAARAYVAKHPDALRAILDATTRSSCRYPVRLTDPYRAEISHLPMLDRLSWLLVAEALVAGEDGDAGRVAAALHGMLRLAGSLKDEPLLVSYLDRLGQLQRVADLVGRIALQTDFDESQYRRLAEALTDALGREQLRRLVIAERVLRLAGPGHEQHTRAASLLGGMGPSPLVEPYLDVVAEYLDALEHEPDHHLVGTLERIDAQWRASLSTEDVFWFDLRELTHAARLNMAVIARLRCAAVALSVARDHARTGRWPARGETFTSPLPAGAAVDPFDGRALRIATSSCCCREGSGGHSAGLVIYSTGPDGAAYGGNPGVLHEPGPEVSVLLSWCQSQPGPPRPQRTGIQSAAHRRGHLPEVRNRHSIFPF